MKHLKSIVFLCILTFAISCGQQKKYIEYKVKQGETISSIARDYNIKVQDLFRLNPDIDSNLKVNSVIIVPNKKKAQESLLIEGTDMDDISKNLDTISIISEKGNLEIIKKYYLVHKVKKGDTFYSLTHFYNVTQEQLKELNPLLTAGLKVDTYIKIKKLATDEEKEENIVYKDVFKRNINLKAALLLPFKTNKLDSLAPEKIYHNNMLANIVTDFYLGAEIAIDSLKKQGINIDLNVYDTGDRESKIRTILSDKNLNKNDVIIGPIYSQEAEIVANDVKIPVVFPVFSSNQSDFSSSKLIKTQPDKALYKEEMIAFMLNNYNGENIVVVADERSKSSSTINKIKKHDSISDVAIVMPTKGYIKKQSIINAMKPDVNNWIIIDTEDDVLAYNVVNSLISLPSSFSAKKGNTEEANLKIKGLTETKGVRLFTFEKGTTFDKIDNNKLAKLNFTYASDVYMDNESFSTKSFNASYFNKNNAYPSYYATKGFDITYDVLARLASGEELKDTFKDGTSYRIESKFSYNNKLFKSTNNNGIFIVQYNKDLSLIRLH